MRFAAMITSLVLLILSHLAHADLYDRVRLEDSLRTRVENAVKVYDQDVRAVIRFDYKKFDGVLPGTNLASDESLIPTQIESNDILKVKVELYTTQKSLSPEIQDIIYKILPFAKNKISVEIKKIEQKTLKEEPKPIDAMALNQIIQNLTSNLSFWFMISAGIGLALVFGFFFMLAQKLLEEFKKQIASVTTAMNESGSTRRTDNSWVDTAALQVSAAKKASMSDGSDDSVEKMSLLSLKELMADCYWCGQDQYASWLWKKISNENRRELLAQLHFMKDYSHYIVDLVPAEESYHEHPYYLEPAVLSEISQSDLVRLVEKDLSLWHQISPMRQNSLPLSLTQKLSAIQSKPTKNKVISSQKSSYRELGFTAAVMGVLSDDDEKALYANPELVPAQLKHQVKSLVWLAMQPQTTLQDILGKYDARSLASAWIGPPEVLQMLEQALSEKKLKLLQTYRTKIVPSRESPAYLQLVNEGLRNAAA